MRLLRDCVFMAGVFCGAMKVTHADHVVTGVVVNAATGEPIKELTVHAYEVDKKLEGKTHITSNKSGESGLYKLDLTRNVSRFKLVFYKKEQIKNESVLFGPAIVMPLSGRYRSEVNVALDSSSGETPRQTQRRLRDIHEALSDQRQAKEVDDSDWAIQYITGIVRTHQSKKEVVFDEELSSVVDTLRLPLLSGAGNVVNHAVLGDRVYGMAQTADEDELKIWSLPTGEAQSPFTIVFPQKIRIKDIHDGNGGSTKLFPTQSGITMVCKSSSPIGRHPRIGSLPAGQTEVQWTNVPADKFVSSITVSADYPWAIRGGSNGSVTIARANEPKEAKEFDLGPFPIGSTAISIDGKLFAAAAIDGKIGVWKLEEANDPQSIKMTYNGRISKFFPSSMAFSSDNQTLLVGTGLQSADGGIVALSFHDMEDPRIAEVDTKAAIDQIVFIEKSTSFATIDHDGKTSIRSLSTDSDVLAIRDEFSLRGIRGVSIDSKRKAAVVIPVEPADPIVFPVGALLDKEFFKDQPFGIAVEKDTSQK